MKNNQEREGRQVWVLDGDVIWQSEATAVKSCQGSGIAWGEKFERVTVGGFFPPAIACEPSLSGWRREDGSNNPLFIFTHFLLCNIAPSLILTRTSFNANIEKDFKSCKCFVTNVFVVVCLFPLVVSAGLGSNNPWSYFNYCLWQTCWSTVTDLSVRSPYNDVASCK